MQTKEYLQLVESELKDYFINKYNIDRDDLEVIQVWYCKTIQNHKGLFIVRNCYGLIYDNFIEATYDGDKGYLYLDFYKKELKVTINTQYEQQKQKWLNNK